MCPAKAWHGPPCRGPQPEACSRCLDACVPVCVHARVCPRVHAPGLRAPGAASPLALGLHPLPPSALPQVPRDLRTPATPPPTCDDPSHSSQPPNRRSPDIETSPAARRPHLLRSSEGGGRRTPALQADSSSGGSSQGGRGLDEPWAAAPSGGRSSWGAPPDSRPQTESEQSTAPGKDTQPALGMGLTVYPESRVPARPWDRGWDLTWKLGLRKPTHSLLGVPHQSQEL